MVFYIKKILAVFAFLFVTNYCFSLQDFVSISGKVLDKMTKNPLANASIGIKGKYVGTIANEQGEFDLHIPAEFVNDTLYVSIIGYSNFSSRIKDIDPEERFTIYLDQRPTILKEVVVFAGLTPQEKIRLGFKNVNENYPSQPFLMEGFYREIKKANGKYVSLIEAAVDLYDKKAYKNPKVKRVHQMDQIDEKGVIKQIRQSSNFLKRELEGQIGLHNNLLAYLLAQNPIKYPTRTPDSTDLLEKTVYLNDKIVFEITEKGSNGELKFYLDPDNYGIVEFHDTRKGQYHERKISDSVSLKYYDLIKTVKFRSINGLLFPQYLKICWKVEKFDRFSERTILTLEIDLELLINKIHIENVTLPSSKEKMEIYSLEWQGGKYDPDFWKNYNIIEETPLHERIRKDLEKESTLEEQFERNQAAKPSKRNQKNHE